MQADKDLRPADTCPDDVYPPPPGPVACHRKLWGFDPEFKQDGPLVEFRLHAPESVELQIVFRESRGASASSNILKQAARPYRNNCRESLARSTGLRFAVAVTPQSIAHGLPQPSPNLEPPRTTYPECLQMASSGSEAERNQTAAAGPLVAAMHSIAT